VRRWRLEQLIGAGYQPTEALVLSGRRVDVDLAVRLLARAAVRTRRRSDPLTLTLKLRRRGAEEEAQVDVQVCLEQAGRFLGYRGLPLPLPSGWHAWNGYRSGALVGSLALACGTAASFDWAEADYEGPFFTAGPALAALDAAALVARLECVYIAPSLRGAGLWRRYVALLTQLSLPVYAAFANQRLRERFHTAHRPGAAIVSATAVPSAAPQIVSLR
jgi:hypothetical protein